MWAIRMFSNHCMLFQDWIGYDVRQVLIETHKLPQEYNDGSAFFKSFRENNLAMYSKEVNGFGEGQFYEFSYVKLRPDFLNPDATIA